MWPRVRAEVLLALELVGLAAFAFSRPVLDSFGRSPETFVAENATRSDIVLFALLVALLPTLVVVVVGVVGGWAARSQRDTVQVVLVALLAGVGAWRMGQDQTGWPGSATKLILLGVIMALLFGFVRWWSSAREVTATFLRYASIAVVVFVVQFLTGSPTSELAFGTAPVVNVDVAEDVSAALGDDPPSVLLVVFDALPTMSLLDGTGSVDEEMFPSFGELADDATFYRNHSTVAAYTLHAVPAILTGQDPEAGTDGTITKPDNLFTLLGGSYNLQVNEPITRMCPDELCPVAGGAGVSPLLGDAMDWWLGAVEEPEAREFDLESAAGTDRYQSAATWTAGLRFGATRRPDLTFAHVVIPHEPWAFTDEGETYEAPGTPTGMGLVNIWSAGGTEVGEQRHLLMAQSADRLLGEMLDELKASGAYDDTMVVVTSDHGQAFTPNEPGRALSEANAAQVAWSPLFVKLPQQTEGTTDDSNVENVDIVPTIADELGVEIPWEVNGYPVAEAEGQRGELKAVVEGRFDILEPESEDGFISLDPGDYLNEVLGYEPATGSGPDGVWKLTEHGELFGEDAAGLEAGSAAEGAAEGEVSVEWSEDFDDVDLDEPLRLEVVAGTDLAEGETVAFALNGTVAALGNVQPLEQESGLLVQGMLPPRLFEDGENELTAYLVDGPVGDEVLHPLDLSFG
jgi:hypothetical protein